MGDTKTKTKGIHERHKGKDKRNKGNTEMKRWTWETLLQIDRPVEEGEPLPEIATHSAWNTPKSRSLWYCAIPLFPLFILLLNPHLVPFPSTLVNCPAVCPCWCLCFCKSVSQAFSVFVFSWWPRTLSITDFLFYCCCACFSMPANYNMWQGWTWTMVWGTVIMRMEWTLKRPAFANPAPFLRCQSYLRPLKSN